MGTLSSVQIAVLLCFGFCLTNATTQTGNVLSKQLELYVLNHKLSSLKQHLLAECSGLVQKLTGLNYPPEFGRRRNTETALDMELKFTAAVYRELSAKYVQCKIAASAQQKSTTMSVSMSTRKTTVLKTTTSMSTTEKSSTVPSSTAMTTVKPTLMAFPGLPNPLGFWAMDSKNGLKDLSGNGNDGVTYNTSFAPGPDGKEGGAILFRGRDDSFGHIPKRNTSLFNRKGSVTLMFWLMPTHLRDWEMPLGFIDDPKSNKLGIVYWIHQNYMEIDDKNMTHSKMFKTVLGYWLRIVVQYHQASELYTVRAGGLSSTLTRVISTVQPGGGFFDTNYHLYLARSKIRFNSYDNFQGRMSCLQIYGDILSDDQLKTAFRLC
ncbi:uncharacterized protein LOC106174752 [Lingula anatina]|uniref:Uncharacterized protein LOC106174752 n=1 Tax=Lingula anatina TaxID=7574 RepID=A0A1S3JP15_LINAN|nr:uncharacterized protein LOC106174752 [Lingula anatina]|eukprot:XP_013411881.1 uncharacterized protein LOC106174752 [Lingula anatina]